MITDFMHDDLGRLHIVLCDDEKFRICISVSGKFVPFSFITPNFNRDVVLGRLRNLKCDDIRYEPAAGQFAGCAE